MHDKMLKGMAQATRLTRAGQLKEATALIQRTLGGLEEPLTSASDEIIDVIAEDSSETQTTYHQTNPSPREKQSQSASSHLWDSIRSIKSKLPQLGTMFKPHRPENQVRPKGQFIDGSYTQGGETRRYKLYIPSTYQGQALPLVVMLHGCTQTPDDFAAGTRMNLLAEEDLFFVLYPAQTTSANSSKCWNWFKISEQQRNSGEPSIIAGMTNKIVNTYHLDSSRVYVAGLSAGGAMAAIMGICYPDVYATVGIHSGLSYGAARDLPSAFAAMQNRKNNVFQPKSIVTQFVPVIVFHGDRDTTVHPCNGEQVISQWAFIHSGGVSNLNPATSLRVTVTQGQVNDGHAYTSSLYHDQNDSIVMEQWVVHGAGHGWSGGSPNGSFTDAKGPDASKEMIRFFKKHSLDIKHG